MHRTAFLLHNIQHKHDRKNIKSVRTGEKFASAHFKAVGFLNGWFVCANAGSGNVSVGGGGFWSSGWGVLLFTEEEGGGPPMLGGGGEAFVLAGTKFGPGGGPGNGGRCPPGGNGMPGGGLAPGGGGGDIPGGMANGGAPGNGGTPLAKHDVKSPTNPTEDIEALTEASYQGVASQKAAYQAFQTAEAGRGAYREGAYPAYHASASSQAGGEVAYPGAT